MRERAGTGEVAAAMPLGLAVPLPAALIERNSGAAAIAYGGGTARKAAVADRRPPGAKPARSDA